MVENASGKATDSNAVYDKELSLCKKCDKEYSSESALRYHLQQNHSDALVECPTCGKGLLTKPGMKMHHSKAHNESIAGELTECCECGDEFRAEAAYGTEFCSDECFRKNESRKHKEKRAEVTCKQCGVEELVKPYREDTYSFCSNDCRYKWQSENLVQEENPNYDPNSRDLFGPNWKEQAEKARKRDDYRCQGCGKNQSDHYKKLIAHHIIPRKKYIDENGEFDWKTANRLSNLITLCDKCHHKWEGVYLKPKLLTTE